MAKKTKKKDMWFKKVRGSYLPCSWQGVLTYIPFLTFLVATVAYNYNTQSSLASVALITFTEWVTVTVVMTWVAWQKS